jgi:uncharacterized integral membrane protein
MERSEGREDAGRRVPEGKQEDRPTAEHLERRRRATIAKVILAVAIGVLFLIFVIQNSDPVPVSFIFTTASIPLVWVFLGCAFIGAAVTFLVGRPGRRAMRKYVRDLERGRGDKAGRKA